MFHSLASIVFYSFLSLESFCFASDLEFAQELWLEEAKSQFNNPVIVMGHGEEVNGKWMLQDKNRDNIAEVQKLAKVFGNFYKNRKVIFVVCNKNDIMIAAPENVLFFRAEVWSVPDSMVEIDRQMWPNSEREIELYSGNAGSIVEAVTATEILVRN